MEPQNIRFGGGAADTVMHPLIAVALMLAIILIFCLPRKYVIVPLLLAIFCFPPNQIVVVAGVHFTVLRIVILAGLGRWAILRSSLTGGFDSMDRLVTLWTFATLIVFSVQWMQTPAIIKSLGGFLDALGGYFVLRFLIRDREDVRRAIKVLGAVSVFMGACMINEQLNHQNVFGLLDGTASAVWVRDGKIRAQGAFAIYIDAGVFGAILVPLLVWLWSDARSRFAAYLGMAGATAMVLTSNSSTPQLAYVSGVVGLCFWPLRRRMRMFRWGLVLTLVGLHLVMKAPVWALIARIDLTGSSTSYHRFELVDQFIRHFSDWWLLGSKDYNNWGWSMWDLSNQYVAVGLTGGLVTFVLFIRIISQSFAGLGVARQRVAEDRKLGWLCWCLGSALLANVVAFFGCSYMSQMQMALFVLLAMITVATSESKRPPATRVKTLSDSHIASVPDPVVA
jgi:hypothetical protein